MKRMLASILVCVFFVGILFAGCKQNKKATVTAEAELSQEILTATEDTSLQVTTTTVEATAPAPSASMRNPATYRPQDRGQNFIETEDYYFYLYNKRIYFSEKENPTFYYLCSKPNCTHGDENCNAYGDWALGWWEGKFYTVCDYDSEPYLTRMDMDGSNREKVAPIEVPIDSTGVGGGCYEGFFANGYFYYDVDALPDSFFRTELSSGQTERLFEDLLADGSGIVYERFDGDYMYFILSSRDRNWFLYRYPLAGGEAQKLCDWSKSYAGWTVENGIAYYFSVDDGMFYEYDVEAGSLTAKGAGQLSDGAAYYDTNFIYLITWEQNGVDRYDCYVYDRSYNLLQHLPIEKSAANYRYAAGDKLFFSRMPSGKIFDYYLISDIGNENAELHKVTDPYALR